MQYDYDVKYGVNIKSQCCVELFMLDPQTRITDAENNLL